MQKKALAWAVLAVASLGSMSFVLDQNASVAASENDLEKWLAASAATGLAGWWAGRKIFGDGQKRDKKQLGCCGLIAVITAVVVALVVLKRNDVF